MWFFNTASIYQRGGRTVLQGLPVQTKSSVSICWKARISCGLMSANLKKSPGTSTQSCSNPLTKAPFLETIPVELSNLPFFGEDPANADDCCMFGLGVYMGGGYVQVGADRLIVREIDTVDRQIYR